MARFSDLPLEIRLLIWEYSLYPPTYKPCLVAAMPRVFRQRYYHADRTLPSVFQICSESRESAFHIAKKPMMRYCFLNWQFVFHTLDKDPSASSYALQKNPSQIITRVWFDFDNDVLYLGRLSVLENIQQLPWKKPHLRPHFNQWEKGNLRFLAVDLMEIYPLFNRLDFQDWPALEIFTVVLCDGFDKPLKAALYKLRSKLREPGVQRSQVKAVFFIKDGVLDSLREKPALIWVATRWLCRFIIQVERIRTTNTEYKMPEIKWCMRNELHSSKLRSTRDENEVVQEVQRQSLLRYDFRAHNSTNNITGHCLCYSPDSIACRPPQLVSSRA